MDEFNREVTLIFLRFLSRSTIFQEPYYIILLIRSNK
jgi:hypothetical protein